MSDDGKIHKGSDNTAPYPVSRMAPAVTLVDIAKEIEAADNMINATVSSKLQVIADQIRSLQNDARRVLEQTQRDQMLHRAQCNFKRMPGNVYHLYRKANGQLYFSMLAPQEWGSTPPHEFEGSFRLENDMSWTAAEDMHREDDSRALINKLLK